MTVEKTIAERVLEKLGFKYPKWEDQLKENPFAVKNFVREGTEQAISLTEQLVREDVKEKMMKHIILFKEPKETLSDYQEHRKLAFERFIREELFAELGKEEGIGRNAVSSIRQKTLEDVRKIVDEFEKDCITDEKGKIPFCIKISSVEWKALKSRLEKVTK